MKNIVVIGGGSGIFNVLKGLKNHPVQITSIVTAFDNGGSTGKLRDEFGTLPQGDIRRSLVALAPEQSSTLRDLFTFRFKEDSSLQGHSFGNLFLQALLEMTGNEIDAIKRASEILGITHTILPVSLTNAHLCATLEDGTVIKGETDIDIPKHDGSLKIANIYLEPSAQICPEAREALLAADLIVIGPGDLYTSILPHTRVEGFREALARTKAPIAYISNTMTKWGETHNFTTTDFAQTLLSHLGIPKIDYLICNNEPLAENIIEAYKKTKSYPVITNKEELAHCVNCVIEDAIITQTDVVRHDADKTARVIMNILSENLG